MPKNSLGRRQHRQTNLLLLSNPNQATSGDFITRTTPRQVSDEDMRVKSAMTLESASPSSSCLDLNDTSMHSKGSLKRVSPTPWLSDMLIVPVTPSARSDSCDSRD